MVYMPPIKKTSPIVEGEQRELIPVVEGEQQSIVEGEQPPLPTVDIGSITETTQRLHKDSDDKILKTFDDDHNFTLTSTKVKKMLNELNEETRIKVKEEAQQYLKGFPLIGKSKKFYLGVLSAKINKYKTRLNA